MPTLVSPGAGPGELREYRFVHQEVTGITTGVLVPGSVRPSDLPAGVPDVTIHFSSDSDLDAVRALYALRAEVLFPNSKGDREHDGLVLVGVLDREIRHTPEPVVHLDGSISNAAGSEPYQAFRLVGWFLRTPFPRWQYMIDNDPDWGGPGDPWFPKVDHRDRLFPKDFERPVRSDLSRFIRAP